LNALCPSTIIRGNRKDLFVWRSSVQGSRGAVFVAVLMALIVALAIVWPGHGERADGPIVTEVPTVKSDGPGSAGTFSSLQTNDIRNTVREYLLENPEVIVEALEILQSRQQQAQRQQASTALAANMERLVTSGHDPAVGNPDASVTIVEFFDYQCPYCKRMAQDIARIAEEDPDVRVVYKEFLVFGAEPTLATRAALASAKQGRYQEFHLAMMELRGAPSETTIMRTASRLGLDLDRLRQDMQSREIDEIVQANLGLAREVGVRGTPAFVIGDRLIPGAMDPESMRALIAEVRGN
jgi:protein-disulfide isomerase